MQSTALRSIVLSHLKYGENNLIVDLFTKESGRITAGLTLSKKKKNLFYYSPLNLIEVWTYRSPKSKHIKIKEAKSSLGEQMSNRDSRIHASRYFIAEFLKNTLHNEETEEQLFSYLESRIVLLYQSKNPGEFLINFLIGLSPFLGFDIKSLKEEFEQSDDFGFGLDQAEWRLLNEMQSGSDESSSANSKRKLDLLIKLYSVPFEGLRRLKSREVLNQVFN